MIKKESKKKDLDLCTEIFHHSFDIITVTLSLPWQYIVVTCLAKNFIITVEPCFMDTHLIQTSSLLQRVFFVHGESPYFFSKSDLLIWMSVKANNDHFFLFQSTDSHRKPPSLLSLMQTPQPNGNFIKHNFLQVTWNCWLILGWISFSIILLASSMS